MHKSPVACHHAQAATLTPCLNISALILFLVVLLLTGHSPALAASPKEMKIADVVEKVSKAIVNIKTEEWTKTAEEGKKSTFFKRLFDRDEEDEEIFENIGSGVVLDPKGIIVTNEHLISKAINIKVRFISGKEYDAYVLGSDPEFDIALLKIHDTADLPYLKVNEKKMVRVGERAIVIGNPYGLSSTVTMGVISALGRNLKIENRTYANLIQTDAAINPGSSGGALLDIEGTPLGIVTAIYGEGKGIGFAIPMEDVLNMLSEFRESTTKRPLLGIFIEKRKSAKGHYLYVNQVIPGGPAERHGIRQGDGIVEMNRKKIREGMKLHNLLRNLESEDSIALRIIRGSKTYMINIPVAEMEKYVPMPLDELVCGIRVQGIKGYPKLKFRLKERDGVVVTKVFKNGISQKSGLRAGDMVIKINNNTILSEKDFSMFMLKGLQRNYILYQVKRGENVFFLPIKLDTLL
jgi:serine protease Do